MTCRLVYFNGRGRAELARLILVYGDVEYEDVRISMEEWPKLKEQTPHGVLPYLEVDGEKIPQSMAIVRYLGRKYDLLGDTLMEEAKINSVIDLMLDMIAELVAYHYEKDEQRKSDIWKKCFDVTIPNTLKCLENELKENKTKGFDQGFIVGGKLSIADLAVFANFETLLKIDQTLLDAYQGVKDLRTKVSALPRISEWLKKRPDTDI